MRHDVWHVIDAAGDEDGLLVADRVAEAEGWITVGEGPESGSMSSEVDSRLRSCRLLPGSGVEDLAPRLPLRRGSSVVAGWSGDTGGIDVVLVPFRGTQERGSRMDEAVAAEERAYWTKELRLRTLDLEAARARGEAPHVLAGAELRLREAEDRLAGMGARTHR